MKFATLLAAFALIGSAAAVANPDPNPEPATVVVKKKVVVYKQAPAPTKSTTRVEYRNGKKVVIVTKGAGQPAPKPQAPSSGSGYSTRVEYRNGKKVVIVTKGKTSSGSGGYPTGQPSTSTWQGIALKLHNDARRSVNAKYRVNMPMLTWSQNLANGACYCSQLNANRDSLDHCGSGENLWKTSDTSISAAEAVRQTMFSWVQEEVGYYRPKSAISGSDPNFHKYGHYTQVVWDDTRRVGCCVRGGRFGTVVTCHYDPDGNFNKQSAY